MQALRLVDSNLNLDVNQGKVAMTGSNIIARTHKLKVINREGTMSCNQAHERRLDESALTNLAEHQISTKGAYKCCQCAYNSGYQQGSLLQKFISLDVDSLGDSHVGAGGNYKSIHQAFALGYSDGVNSCIRN